MRMRIVQCVHVIFNAHARSNSSPTHMRYVDRYFSLNLLKTSRKFKVIVQDEAESFSHSA